MNYLFYLGIVMLLFLTLLHWQELLSAVAQPHPHRLIVSGNSQWLAEGAEDGEIPGRVWSSPPGHVRQSQHAHNGVSIVALWLLYLRKADSGTCFYALRKFLNPCSHSRAGWADHCRPRWLPLWFRGLDLSFHITRSNITWPNTRYGFNQRWLHSPK